MATATALAARLGTNSGATSDHLRQLADAGLVEDDRSRSNGRDRWWKPVHDSTSWVSIDFDDGPDARAADDWLARNHARRAAGRMVDWLDGRAEWPSAWRAAAEHADHHLDLTPRRAAGAHGRTACGGPSPPADPAPPSPHRQRVTLLLQSFPSPDRTV